MSLKAELETWAAALKAYDAEDFEKSLELFASIADSSKILTNMGLIYATLGEHEAAVERFNEATQLDQFLAVAYFQCGVSNFLLGQYELALKDFEEALLYLRGNQAINYEQIGLKFLLYSAEVLFNKGLSLIYLGRTQEGIAVMEEARQERATEEHNVIEDAIQDQGEGYTVFSIPVGVLYRPSENKLKNAKAKDYLGKARLIAASENTDAFTNFSGATRLQQGLSPTGAFVERPNLDTSGSPVVGLRSAALASPSGADGTPLSRLKSSASLSSPVGQASPVSEPTPTIARSNTTINTAKASPNATIGGPMRGMSIKRPGASPSGASADKDRTIVSPAKERNNRMTDFYDNYLTSYTEEPVPPLPGTGNGTNPDRVAAWARSNANPNNPPQRAPSRSAPPSMYAPSSHGTGSVRRKLSRRPTARSRGPVSMYEEEEEGYGSGEYEDGPFDLTKIRIKLHYQDDVRGMAITPELAFEEFMKRVTTKFGKGFDGLELKFNDEDGGKVSLRDESDYELAIEIARESAKGKPEGKLEIWCSDA